ncbi:MAG: hypothetical protein SH850_25295 [Planctomycetaceae bacterium]|nr:hypothetical protein [Planctomycetaceae bacterium]
MRAMALTAATAGLLLAALVLGAALQQTPTQPVELTVLTDDN